MDEPTHRYCQALKKRRESRVGVPTYHIQRRACGEMFSRMINQTIRFSFVNSAKALTVKGKACELLREWDDNQQFIMCELSNRNLGWMTKIVVIALHLHCLGSAQVKVMKNCHQECAICFQFLYKKLRVFLTKL